MGANSPWRPRIPSRHGQICPKFIDKNQVVRIALSDLLREGPADRSCLVGVPLGRMQRLFFRVIPSRRNARLTVKRLTTT
jgi:hypothetical protein